MVLLTPHKRLHLCSHPSFLRLSFTSLVVCVCVGLNPRRPYQPRDTDFSRVRTRNIDQLAVPFRQVGGSVARVAPPASVGRSRAGFGRTISVLPPVFVCLCGWGRVFQCSAASVPSQVTKW